MLFALVKKLCALVSTGDLTICSPSLLGLTSLDLALLLLYSYSCTTVWCWFSSRERRNLQEEETAPQAEQSGQWFRSSSVSGGQRFRLLAHRRVQCSSHARLRPYWVPHLHTNTTARAYSNSVSVCRLGTSKDALKSTRNKPTSGVMYSITYVGF